ncbi:hypothetical protein QZH41_013591 [Actinostola sp. cb2023]|nr:hypothetical protein QZH41_013591 [Actinostola sp. cb2023]
MRQLYAAKSATKASGMKVETSAQTEVSPQFEQHSSAIHRNVAGPYAYPRLQPPRAFHFAQNNAESLAYYLNMSPPGLATPPNDHSPVHHISPLIGRQLNVSDNSAFVRFSPRLNSIHGQASNGWPACEVIESKDAAFALASLQHKTTSRLRLK